MRGQKQERILRVMLSHEKPLSKNELSKRAQCTRQWVILFLRKLEKISLVKNTEIINKKGILNFWLKIRKKPKYKEYMVKQPISLLKKINLDYAITTYHAENIIQHHLFPSRVDIYIKEEDIEKWHKLMTDNGLYGKGNVRLIITDDHVMYNKRKIENLFIVTMPQLIIDLFSEGGPCSEAAEMLMKRL